MHALTKQQVFGSTVSVGCLGASRASDAPCYAVTTVPSNSLLQVFDIVKADKQLPPDFFLTKALPVGLFMALTLYLSNIAYLYLTVRCRIEHLCAFVGSLSLRLQTLTSPPVVQLRLWSAA
jgi:hypothetical protein